MSHNVTIFDKKNVAKLFNILIQNNINRLYVNLKRIKSTQKHTESVQKHTKTWGKRVENSR